MKNDDFYIVHMKYKYINLGLPLKILHFMGWGTQKRGHSLSVAMALVKKEKSIGYGHFLVFHFVNDARIVGIHTSTIEVLGDGIGFQIPFP